MLYSRAKNLWILTDFSFAMEATSKGERTTRYSRGTSSYRAPELLKGPARFRNKVDIWAMGCVLYEVSTHGMAFLSDHAVLDYKDGSYSFPPIESPISPFWRQQLSTMIHDVLNIDPMQRPRVWEVAAILSS